MVVIGPDLYPTYKSKSYSCCPEVSNYRFSPAEKLKYVVHLIKFILRIGQYAEMSVY